jgi:hypothetical protein
MRASLAVLLWAAILAGGAPRQQSDIRVPRALTAAAERGPLALALALAPLGIPAGLVTTENPSQVEPVDVDPAAGRTTPLGTVLGTLTAGHPGYSATWRSGVLGIEAAELECGRIARTRTLKPARLVSDMPRLLGMLAWLASGDPPPVPGGQISTIGGDGAIRPGSPLPSLELEMPQALSLESAFDTVVRLNKGGVWIIWQHRRGDGAIGCRSVGYYSNGQVGASSRDFAVVPAGAIPDSSRPTLGTPHRPGSYSCPAATGTASRSHNAR